MSKEQKITNKIKARNQNQEALKANFSHCFDKNGNFDFEKFKRELSANEINFSKESYGLDWLGKSYARILASDSATTLLKEDEKHNQKEENKSSENLLIKGDNLEVLKHLTNAYYEKVKMIYIDPPYNTGDDGFVYQDDRKFTISELKELAGIDEEKAKRILDFTQSNSNSHSAWLTFMYPRLYVAKQLLTEEGVIFVSIDDNEVAQLKILMDEVFGEENFINKFIWRNGRTSSAIYTKEQEYILVYGKNAEKIKLIRYLGDDEIISERAIKKIGNKNPASEITFPKGIRFESSDKIFPDEFGNSEIVKVTQGKLICKDGKLHENVTLEAGWVMKDMIEDWIEGNEVFDSKGQKVTEFFFKDNGVLQYVKEKGTIHPKTIIEGYSTKSGTNEIAKLMGFAAFDYPKPIGLIQFLQQISDKNSIVLDFFAGSGTTGHAVMQSNAEDGGDRKYILIQLPELIDAKKSKTAYDFVKNELKVERPTIFEITKERLIRASKKVKEETMKNKIAEIEKEIKALGKKQDSENKEERIQELKTTIENLKNQDLGFKIFETMPIWEDYNFKADKLEVQATLFDDNKLTQDGVKTLLVTWKTYDGIPLPQDLQAIDLNGYKGYYANHKLYLMDKGFTTDNLKTLLEKIDTDKDFNPTSIIAFGYYFESKNLREISENMKSYANKKNIDIDFITRY